MGCMLRHRHPRQPASHDSLPNSIMEQFSDTDSQTERGFDEVMSVGGQLALPVYRPRQTLAQLEALQTPKRASSQ